eukprot:CAMPEP_0203944656 /NCGR_PEP_ID=MMETSP0359-20131031/80372_1 /ASSEMBLY_ACC=CAM_ASM_000338 /TAXON_ID=268821 /ORGANISM="Scrippsiella Hangoei, Strain SHTV-5" /LENGTH=718 /DNA_ID=CAMNT_0050875707 /DNA_START=77 /DNA_END=2230 /DNA_ORIENTATION=-
MAITAAAAGVLGGRRPGDAFGGYGASLGGGSGYGGGGPGGAARAGLAVAAGDSEARSGSLALVRKIRITLVNHAHMDLVVNEAFQATLGEKLQQADDTFIGLSSSGGAPTEPAADYDTSIALVCSILERMQIPYVERSVKAWAAQACSTFAHSRDKANIMTAARVRFVVQWVLRCLSELAIRGMPDFFDRAFLEGFDHGTQINESGIQLSGAVAHGVYGNIWLHAKDKSTLKSAQPSPRANAFVASAARAFREGRTREFATQSSLLGLREVPKSEYVVCSISKTLCKLPPDLMSRRIRFLIEMDPIPYVLPLRDAYEDYEHIHLVYDSLSPNALCIIDKVFEDMHSTEGDESEDRGFSERTVQQIIWRLLTATKEAHSRGLVHGALRMGCCYLNGAESLDTLQILEFGLADLFETPAATPPAALLTPLETERTDPVPQYRRDLQCIAEITYLLLMSQPIASLNSTAEELAQRSRRGTACFDFAARRSTTENAKAFVVDILRPTAFKKASKIQACHEVAVHMNHRWFYPDPGSVGAMTELYDMVMMRRYDTWRNTLRLRTNFFKILADHMSLYRIAQLWDTLTVLADGNPKVSWSTMVPEIFKHCPVLHLLQKVNKAFGESEDVAVIPIRETHRSMEAWRRKRVREVIWQVFSRAKAYNGTMSAEACADGLTSKVLHVWSRPLRVIDVLLPTLAGESSRRVSELIGLCKTVGFLELLTR